MEQESDGDNDTRLSPWNNNQEHEKVFEQSEDPY